MATTFIFDLDGTLVDTSRGFIIAFNALLAQHGQYPLDDDTISETISSGARSTIRMAWQQPVTDKQVEEFRYEFLDIYQGRKELCSVPAAVCYPGLFSMLQTLKSMNCKTGIVTNKTRRLTQPILDNLGLTQFIDTIICPEDCKIIKPDPFGLLLAISNLDSELENCVYVGDHIKDIHTANAAKITSIAVDYGFKLSNDDFNLWPANYFAETPEQLVKLIYQLSNKETA